MSVDRDSLVRGIDFYSLEDACAACQYPITSEQLAECLRDEEVGHGGGRTRVGEAIDGLEGVFDSPREVQAALLDGAGTNRDALGHPRPPTHSSESREYTARSEQPPFKRPGDL